MEPLTLCLERKKRKYYQPSKEVHKKKNSARTLYKLGKLDRVRGLRKYDPWKGDMSVLKKALIWPTLTNSEEKIEGHAASLCLCVV